MKRRGAFGCSAAGLRQGTARQDRRGWACLGTARRGTARSGNAGSAGRDMAWLGGAGHGEARQARSGVVWRGGARYELGEARQAWSGATRCGVTGRGSLRYGPAGGTGRCWIRFGPAWLGVAGGAGADYPLEKRNPN